MPILVRACVLVAGLAGSLLPFLPGAPLILAAGLVHAVVTDFISIGAARLSVLAGLAVLAFVVDYVAGAFGAKRFGGSVLAGTGALSGTLVGSLARAMAREPF